MENPKFINTVTNDPTKRGNQKYKKKLVIISFFEFLFLIFRKIRNFETFKRNNNFICK